MDLSLERAFKSLTSGGDDEVILGPEVDLTEVEKAMEHFPALADLREWLDRPV